MYGLNKDNLIIDSELARASLSPDVLKVLRTGLDEVAMPLRVPINPHTCPAVGTDTKDTADSGTQGIINNLPLYIHDLRRWSKGFNAVKYYKHQARIKKDALATYIDSEHLTKDGRLLTRKRPVNRR